MKQLFIDDHMIENIDNLARKLHQPRKFEGTAVVRPEYRWENCALQVRSAPVWVPEEGLFKLIYHSSAEPLDADAKLGTPDASARDGFACYATSTDGVNWEKPFLELYDYKGLNWDGSPLGARNNIVPDARGMLLGPIYDANDPDPKRRYKGLREGVMSGRTPLASADCLHWRELDIPAISSSDEAQFTYDENKRLFILTVKHGGPYGRSVYLTTSPDFEHWSEQVLIFHADAEDQENGRERLSKFFQDPAYLRPVYNRPEDYRTDVYHMAVFPYEGLYLGMPVMFHWSGKHPPLYENVDGRKTIELTSSRDLLHWNRVANRAAFLPLSPVGDGSAYDTGQLEPTNHPVIRNKEIWFYYTGLRRRCESMVEIMARGYLDGGAVCLARLRLDGFVSLRGMVEWGSVTTKPLVVEGRELRINVDSWRGQVRAEVLDAADGKVLPGFTKDECIPAVIDSVNEGLRWKTKADLSALLGRTVRLRFWIWKADLYAYWFGA